MIEDPRSNPCFQELRLYTLVLAAHKFPRVVSSNLQPLFLLEFRAAIKAAIPFFKLKLMFGRA